VRVLQFCRSLARSLGDIGRLRSAFGLDDTDRNIQGLIQEGTGDLNQWEAFDKPNLFASEIYLNNGHDS